MVVGRRLGSGLSGLGVVEFVGRKCSVASAICNFGCQHNMCEDLDVRGSRVLSGMEAQ